MSQISMAKTLITAYGDREPWKEQHDRAMLCREVEDIIDWGIVLFHGLSDAEARYQSQVIHCGDAENRSDLDETYRSLTGMFRRCLNVADKLTAEGFMVERLDEFRAIVHEAECLVESADFEVGLPAIEDMERIASPANPRPDRYPS